MIIKAILYFGKPAAIACDEQCQKAWGSSARPRSYLHGKKHADDYELLSDSELSDAPKDPGTWEGVDRKPQTPEQRLNRWCCRECERCVLFDTTTQPLVLPDFSKRVSNTRE